MVKEEDLNVGDCVMHVVPHHNHPSSKPVNRSYFGIVKKLYPAGTQALVELENPRTKNKHNKICNLFSLNKIIA